MVDKNDCRLTNQMDFLFGKELKHTFFHQWSKTWDHEHCEFCFETIKDDSNMEYCTLDNYHWICEKCFNDFNDMFKWQVVNE